MFSIFDLVILILCVISYIFATACWLDKKGEKNKKMEYLTYAISFILGIALAMYWLRAFYFDSKTIYWVCVVGVAIVGHLGLLCVSGIIIGVIGLIFNEILKLDIKLPQTMAVPFAIISLVCSFVLLGSTIIELPKILSQTEIEVNEIRIAKAKEAAERKKESNAFMDSLMNEHVNHALEILPTISSEQSYKYKCMKLQECRDNLHSAGLLLSDSTVADLIKKSKCCLDNGIYNFYTNIYNWAQEDKNLIVNKALVKVQLDINQYNEIYNEENGVFIDIKTDGSNESNSRLNHYLNDMNIHIDSALTYIYLYQQEYQKLLKKR